MSLVIGGFGSQFDCAEMNEGTIASPMNRGVIHHVVVICDLDMDVELNRTCRDAARQFVKQVVLALRLAAASSRCSTPALGEMQYLPCRASPCWLINRKAVTPK